MVLFYPLTVINPSATDPHLVVLVYANNTPAEVWIIKATKASLAGRSLGYIQGAILVVNKPVVINAAK